MFIFVNISVEPGAIDCYYGRMESTIDNKTLNDKIRRGMERLGINQAELSRRSGITRSALTQILSGDRTPSTQVVMSLSGVLGLSVDYLLGRTEASEIEDILQNEKILQLVRGFLKLSAKDQERVLQLLDFLQKTEHE